MCLFCVSFATLQVREYSNLSPDSPCVIAKGPRGSVEIPQQAVKSRSLQVAAVLHLNVLL